MADLADINPEFKTLDGTKLKSTDVANPCGLIAKYFFNDTYVLKDSADKNITIDETNIAHNIDREYKFKKAQVDNPNSI